jgi:hypothetical protein
MLPSHGDDAACYCLLCICSLAASSDASDAIRSLALQCGWHCWLSLDHWSWDEDDICEEDDGSFMPTVWHAELAALSKTHQQLTSVRLSYVDSCFRDDIGAATAFPALPMTHLKVYTRDSRTSIGHQTTAAMLQLTVRGW